ncbi:hypothetical protein WJX79_004158 [Trebouxia sp. C0005]
MLRASSWQAPGQTVQQQQAEYGPNMPGGADRLPEQTLEQGMGTLAQPGIFQTGARDELRNLSKGQLDKEEATAFAVKLFRQRDRTASRAADYTTVSSKKV